jgi:hypothetical protein
MLFVACCLLFVACRLVDPIRSLSLLLPSVPELVEGPEPLLLRLGASFKAYALRGIFAFPR